MANLVHRDFENEIAKFGDVVNTRKPGEFKVRRKVGWDRAGPPGRHGHQRAGAAGPVVLRILHHPGRRRQQVLPGVEGHLPPPGDVVHRPRRGPLPSWVASMPSWVARKTACGSVPSISTNAKDYVLDAREVLNVNKAPLDGRRLVMSPTAETAMLKTELFVAAQKRGDGGEALTTATLGTILGFDTFMCRTSTARQAPTANRSPSPGRRRPAMPGVNVASRVKAARSTCGSSRPRSIGKSGRRTLNCSDWPPSRR